MKSKFTAAIGGISLPALMMASADAQVVRTGDTLVLDLNSLPASVSYDFNGDTVSDFSLVSDVGDGVGFTGNFALEDSSGLPRLYNSGELLEFSGSFASSLLRLIIDLPAGPNTESGSLAFFGLKFTDITDPQNTQELLGYFSLAYDQDLNQVLVENLTYEQTTGVDLRITVPEPTSLACLAIGAAGMLAVARLRQ